MYLISTPLERIIVYILALEQGWSIPQIDFFAKRSWKYLTFCRFLIFNYNSYNQIQIITVVIELHNSFSNQYKKGI